MCTFFAVGLGSGINDGGSPCSGGDDEHRLSAMEVVVRSLCSTYADSDSAICGEFIHILCMYMHQTCRPCIYVHACTYALLLYVTVHAKTSLVCTKIHFLAQLIATHISYLHSMSPMARLNWSAFLGGGFTTL